ncbi:unnamed protein product [Brassica oleracea]
MVIHRSSSARTHSLISMYLLFYLFFSFYPNLFFTLFLFSSLPSTCINGDLGLNQPKKVIDVKLRKEEARGKKGSN